MSSVKLNQQADTIDALIRRHGIEGRVCGGSNSLAFARFDLEMDSDNLEKMRELRPLLKQIFSPCEVEVVYLQSKYNPGSISIDVRKPGASEKRITILESNNDHGRTISTVTGREPGYRA